MSMSVNVNPNGLLIINPLPNEVSTSETNPVSNQQPDVRSDDTGPKEAPARNEPAAHREFIDSLFKKAAARGKDRITLTKKDLAGVKDADGAKVDKTTFKAAETARKDAEKKMGALKGYTRAQLIATLKMPGDFTTTKAGQAFRTAIDAQLELADKLSACARASSGDTTSLEHLSMQANLRAAELSRLLGELMMEAEAPNPAEDIQLEANENWLGESLARIGTDTDSNRHALDFLEQQADIRLSELPAFAAEDKTLTPDEIAAMTARLGNLSTAIETARREGIDFRGDKSGRTMVDPAVFDALDREIKAARGRLRNHTRQFVTAALIKFAKEFKLPSGANVSNPKIFQLAKETRITSGLMISYIKERMSGKAKKDCDSTFNFLRKQVDLLSTELPSAFPGADRGENIFLGNHFPALLHEIVDALDHWAPDSQSAPPQQIAARTSDVRALLKGDLRSVDDYIEAHVHGYDVSAIDPEISGKRIIDCKMIGQGAFNKVYLCTFDLGNGLTTQRVFKPELSAHVSIGVGIRSSFGEQMKFQKALGFNMASQKVADLLGAGDRIVKTSIGTFNGQFGMFMEFAPGKSPADILTKKETTLGTDQQPGLSPQELQDARNAARTDTEKKAIFSKVAGAVARQLNQLQWFDLISGQLDRHDGNYHIYIPRDIFDDPDKLEENLAKVRVTGVDNDAAFPEDIRQIGVLTLNQDAELSLKSKYKDYKREKGQKKLSFEKFFPAKVRTKRQDGSFSYDLMKMNPAQREVITKHLKMYNGFIPSVIDVETKNKIAYYATQGQEEFRQALKTCRLTDRQIEAALDRLRSAHAYIEQHEDEIVVQDDAWPDIGFKRLASPNANSSVPLGVPDPNNRPVNFFQRAPVTQLFGFRK